MGKITQKSFPKEKGFDYLSCVWETEISRAQNLEILEIEDNEKRREKACCSKSLQLWKSESKQSLKVMVVNCRKVKRVRSVKNRVKGNWKQGKEKRGGNEKENKRYEELCKKRILMGGKCRPLNVSGVLHHHQDGILLPEDVLP